MIEVSKFIAATCMLVLSISLIGILCKLFYMIVIEELWPAHGWKLFKHPTLKPGVRVTIVIPAWRGWAHCAGQTGTIQKQVYRSIWSVLIDGEVEPHRYYIEEMELAACPKAYEELFI